MDDKEFFFLDRPAVPATQQNLIDPVALLEHAVAIRGSEIHPDEVLFASEVKGSNGNVVGTVLYTTSSYADLLESHVIEEDEATETFDADEPITFGDTQ